MSPTARVATLLDAARGGDRVALARLLSVVENDEAGARALAVQTWSAPGAFAIGITGAPGVGKSTLTGRLLGELLARHAGQVGVVCVDPTSPFSGGAILGDRLRMQDHALDERVFIRSLASRGHLGGLSVAVPDAVAVLGATGFELVVIETVGVGQVELDVAATADATVVVVTPGWGDATQAAKAGILEVADVFVVNKADRPGAAEAVRDLNQMLDLGEPNRDGWRPPVVTTVASEGSGTGELLDAIDAFRAHASGPVQTARRAARADATLRRLLAAHYAGVVDELATTEGFAAAVEAVAARRSDPYTALEALLRA